ncbi:unnamed protein product [Ilex paraguariensis]|uniref:Disease resistance protein At4g27190-like leucine-rich repeats domain-containing protein n=1 Tax=Ilex paraguariensis TaxID=185542 RepID=A0ABC8SBX1_9AQUA
MRYVLPLTVVKLLINLRELDISHCEMLEEIIEPEQDRAEIKEVEEIVTKKGGEEMAMEKIEFPQLSDLALRSLTNFTGFCSSKFELEFPSLIRLWIQSCRKMKTFCSRPVCALKIPNLGRIDCSDDIVIGWSPIKP